MLAKQINVALSYDGIPFGFFTSKGRQNVKNLAWVKPIYHSGYQSHYIEVAQEAIFMEQNVADFGPVGNTEKKILGR